jgi:hypothetical protein
VLSCVPFAMAMQSGMGFWTFAAAASSALLLLLLLYFVMPCCCSHIGTRTIALDSTFGSVFYTLLELVSFTKIAFVQVALTKLKKKKKKKKRVRSSFFFSSKKGKKSLPKTYIINNKNWVSSFNCQKSEKIYRE